MPDIVTSKTFVDGEKGITAAKMNQIISGAVIQPSFYSTKPSSPTLDSTDVLLELKASGAYAQITGAQIASSVSGQLVLADTTQNGMLRKVSGLATDIVDGTNNCQNFASSPALTLMRLRSFNAVGNPTTEVNQRNPGVVGANAPAGYNALFIDRWNYQTPTAPATISFGQAASPIALPGSNFLISNSTLKLTLVAQKTSLVAGDLLYVGQQIEGPRLRELINDVHSVSLLVRSSVANLQFGLSLCDPGATRSISKLCTIPSANVLTLIPLPNLPVFPPAGTFNLVPGNPGYWLRICLAAGTTFIAPANDAWQNGNYVGAVGQGNFCAQPIGATFELAFVQHEPGPACTLPMDCPFTQNYDECLRYYAKSYDYQTVPAANGAGGNCDFLTSANTTWALGWAPFPKPLAATPTTLTIYSLAGGASNATVFGGAAISVSNKSYSSKGISALNIGTAQAVGTGIQFHYIADTGL